MGSAAIPTAGAADLSELARRVAAHLADIEAATVPDVARAVRARDADVRNLLLADVRFERRPAPPGRAGQARCYGLSTKVVPRDGTTSGGLNGRGPCSGSGRPVAPLEGQWWPPLFAGPRSVREAIACAEGDRA